ncbi:hypothetical protein BD309DRAFT_861349 [Dichomitus squalens]|uniref:Uncharacterized protein n=1 Tax=Dichomitus squalens TaxID=114155 RepID=A0A4Q9PKT3_9APHY|nr:hypothetical protein BD309DRAFT_861349 [Dichomitus squalens]TBU54780.1 hypothetical protein BD310DRAFT_980094 [Dichomitus squalens]
MFEYYNSLPLGEEWNDPIRNTVLSSRMTSISSTVWTQLHHSFFATAQASSIQYQTGLLGDIAHATGVETVLSLNEDESTLMDHFEHSSFRRAINHNMHATHEYWKILLNDTEHPQYHKRPDFFAAYKKTSSARDIIDDIEKTWEDPFDGPETVLGLFRKRLNNYPTKFTIDGAVTVAIPAFFDNLSNAAEGTEELSEELRFFETDPGQGDRPAFGCSMQGTALCLPVLLVREQLGEGAKGEIAARQEQRIAISSAAWFLKVLGIIDFPVYGLMIDGQYAYLSQAWYSEKDECCFVMDYCIRERRFDVQLQEGQQRYIAFLKKIVEHGERLERRFQEVKPQLLERMKAAGSEGIESLWWSTTAQRRRHGLSA